MKGIRAIWAFFADFVINHLASNGSPEQEGTECMARKDSGSLAARPSQTGDGADLDIFGALGASLGVVLDGVSGFARSAAQLLPIAEEQGPGKPPEAHSSSNASCAPSRQVSSRTHASLRERTKSASTLSEESAPTSARSKGSTLHRRGSCSSLDVSGAQRAAVKQQVWQSLPSAKDRLRVPKQRDPCDKATHSKISSWMSKAEPAPPPPPADVGGRLMLFNKLAELGLVSQ